MLHTQQLMGVTFGEEGVKKIYFSCVLFVFFKTKTVSANASCLKKEEKKEKKI